MARDLARDQKMFNCNQQHEIDYVVSLYPGHEKAVRNQIHQGCTLSEIKYFNHMELYQYIQKKLGLPVPV